MRVCVCVCACMCINQHGSIYMDSYANAAIRMCA